MKNFFKYAMMIVAVVMSAVVISSCSKDDDQELNQSSLVGTWVCTSSIDKGASKTYTDALKGDIVTVNADGTYTSNSDIGSGSYTISGNIVTVRKKDGTTLSIQCSLSGSTMTWTGSANGYSFTYIFQKK